MMKTVCIVGAGPSGLTAAKSLLHDVPANTTFSVTMFEAQSRIGGLWPVHRDDNGGMLHPLMVTNQSRHTMQFSALAWEDDDPELPCAWQVGRYLERYRKMYCQGVTMHLGHRVERAVPVDGKWEVVARSGEGKVVKGMYDHLLVASGFFGKPVTAVARGLVAKVPVIHSGLYRNIQELLGKTSAQGGKILVVGGQMSGVDIASTIATHLSSAMNAPWKASGPNADKFSVHHLVQRPVWIFPLFTPITPKWPAPSFIPLDIPAYNLANRPGELVNIQGHVPPEAAEISCSLYEMVLGTNQAEFSPLLAQDEETRKAPQYLTVSDHYTNFVRSGLITLSKGKLDTLAGRTATVIPNGETIEDIAAVVLATGFEAASSLSFLPESVREMLALDGSDLNITVTLAFHGTHHPQVPNLGFVGFYRSPYWGVMEMQARFLTALWSAGPTLPPSLASALELDDSIQRTLALRNNPHTSQFAMGDYAWLMSQFAKALDLELQPQATKLPALPPHGLEMNIVTPARYLSLNTTPAQIAESSRSLEQVSKTVLAGYTCAKFVARAIFRSLCGTWRLERDVVSELPSYPSGHFSGTAEFRLREETMDGRETLFEAARERGEEPGLEYLYIEDGTFSDGDRINSRATRRYIWRYDEQKDRLSVWFVKKDDQVRADYLFHEINFKEGREGWEGKADHLCVEDFYEVNYLFRMKCVEIGEWRLGYGVKGPKKNYRTEGRYVR